jgi:GNAT superfamily N-acetyltransferase
VASAVDGNPVGVAYASCLLSLEHGGFSGWLEELYVLPEWRGRGIGSCLIAEVITRAKELGWRAIDLEVDVGHQRAISLYTRYLISEAGSIGTFTTSVSQIAATDTDVMRECDFW